MKRIGLLLVFAVTVTACLGDDFSDSLTGPWQLTSGDVNGQSLTLVDTHPVTLTIDGNTVGGTASCNQYGGELDRSGSSFDVTNLAVTEMACFPPETMDLETTFLQALSEADTLGIDNEGLLVSGEGIELHFEALEPVPMAELTGTVWVLDGLVQGDAVTSVTGDPATLELFTDGSFIGSTGCRDISGSYVVSGAEVTFTNLGATGECNEDLGSQDSRVISALEGGFRVEIDGDRMTTWVAGDEGLVYRADPTS